MDKSNDSRTRKVLTEKRIFEICNKEYLEYISKLAFRCETGTNNYDEILNYIKTELPYLLQYKNEDQIDSMINSFTSYYSNKQKIKRLED